MTLQGVRIAGVGHYVPERILSNADFEKMFDTTDEWIVSRTGMKERRIARDDQPTSDLAYRAAVDCLTRSGFTAGDMDLVVVATVSPDYFFPATACIVGARLGIAGKPCFDFEIACSGFIYGLTFLSQMIRTGLYKRILFICADKLSHFVDYEDRSTAVLFGDGAGAVILEHSDRNSFLSASLGADGSVPENLWVKAGGTAHPSTAATIAAKEDRIYQNGKEVFKFAVIKMTQSLDAVLAEAHLTEDDVAFLIPHQANKRIIDAAAKRLQMPYERIVVTVHKYGNTSAASIPIALSETVREGKLKDGDVIVFVGMGGGLSWGAVAWKWAQ
ncbi:MAG: beta-ketoacyl-ACP synthase III [Candidatus Velthaea sp.]